MLKHVKKRIDFHAHFIIFPISFHSEVYIPEESNMSRKFKSEARLSQTDITPTAMNTRHEMYSSSYKISENQNVSMNLVGDRLLCSKESRLLSVSNAQLAGSRRNLSGSRRNLSGSNNSVNIKPQPSPRLSRTVSHNPTNPPPKRSPREVRRTPSLDAKKSKSYKQPLKEKKSSGLFGLFGKKK